MRKGYYKKLIIEQMKQLAIYQPEYDLLISTLAQTCEDRDMNNKEWLESSKENGYKHKQMVIQYTNKAGATNISKSPYYLNNLQFNEQILKYCKELCLSPSGIKKLGNPLEEKEDAFERFVNGESSSDEK